MAGGHLPSQVSVGLVQMACAPDRDSNLEKALAGIRQAAGRGAQVVCLQELFPLPYFCQDQHDDHFSLAEAVPDGKTTRAMACAARELSIVIVAPVFEKRAEGLYHNTAVVLDSDGSLAGIYRKMHIPHDPLYYEKFYFTPGDSGFRAISTRYGKIGVLICWDQWFPEAARLTALAGARIIFYPTAIGWSLADDLGTREAALDAWVTVQRAHAVSNGVFVGAVNRTGREKALEFWGHSFVSDPFGKILKRCAGEEAVLVTECDFSLIGQARREWPFWRDRRVDAYGLITSRFLDEEK